MNTLGRRIRDRRLGLKWTQEQLACKTGMHQPDISHLELGRTHDPRGSTLFRLASALGVGIGWLMDENPKKLSEKHSE